MTIVLAALALTGCSGGQARRDQPSSSSGSPTGTADGSSTGSETVAVSQIELTLTPLWKKLKLPLYLTFAPGDSSRLFIVEQAGRIRVVKNGRLIETPFLDITTLISSEGEQGLLGLAFSPEYATTGRFYVYYTDTAGDVNLVRYTVADPASSAPTIAEQRRVLFIKQAVGNHYGGCIVFGPDRYLYVGTGEGASPGDFTLGAQNPQSLFGKILRLDVGEGPGDRSLVATYRVPKDNPFAGKTGYRPELWALGLRNPWRFSFDRKTGDLWIGDVGQSEWEEVDRIARGTDGQNFGWSQFEGAHQYPPGTSSPTDPAGFTMPIAEYPHSSGKCVIGGFVYRGSQHPALRGVYLYADWVSGRIWGMRSSGSTETAELVNTSLSIGSFGEDAAGEVYVCDLSSGTIFGIAATAR